MSSKAFGGLFRHVLTAVGGGLVATGVIQPDVGAGITDIATTLQQGAGDPITRQELIGAIVTVVGFVWSWKEKGQRPAT